MSKNFKYLSNCYLGFAFMEVGILAKNFASFFFKFALPSYYKKMKILLSDFENVVSARKNKIIKNGGVIWMGGCAKI